MIRRIVDALSVVAAAAFAYYGAVVLWEVAAFGRAMIVQGSGGLGAVSAGLTDAISIAMMACLALNVLLSKFARRAGGMAGKLHRTHSFTLACLLACIVLFLLLLTLSRVSGQLMTSLFLLIGILVGVQFWLLALLLIAFIRRPAAPMAA